MAEPEARGVRPDVQLVWNIRGVLIDLVNRNPASPPSTNVPLIARGLSPTVFSAVPPTDLLTGIRGVWELNRVELLADAFAVRPCA